MNNSQTFQVGAETMSCLFELQTSGRLRFRKTSSRLYCVLLIGLLLASCVQKTAVEAPAYWEGQATLVYSTHNTEHSEAYLDLDKGSVLDNADADIALLIDGGTDLYAVLLPINGAKTVRLVEKEDLGLDDCRDNLDNLSTTNIPDFPPGTGICVLTNQGRLALMIIDGRTGIEPDTSNVQVSFVVEVAPQP